MARIPFHNQLRLVHSLFLFCIIALASSSSLSAQCTADAGTLGSFKQSDCLQLPGGTVIGGIPIGDAVVPSGFATTYILSTGPGLTIVDYGSSNLFNVQTVNSYNIHTIVYDVNTFSLNSFVTIGTTTVFDVNNQFVGGGGSICADVDIVGTTVLVDIPDAGAISADSALFCLSNGSATITATPDGNQYLPPGFSQVFFLSQGASNIIVDMSPNPSFTVAASGSYGVHTFVFDPTTFNLGLVQFGITSTLDLNALLLQGGGVLCGAFDVMGTSTTVAPCTGTCLADAGSLDADSGVYCWDMNGIMVTATPDGNAVVPAGYQTLYLLSEGPGLIIQDVQSSPMFTVMDSGLYAINVLVYDPSTYDPNTIVLGTTSAYDISPLFLQGGGTICGAIALGTAQFKIVTCNGCVADAGTITPDTTIWCQDNSGIWVSATPDGNMTVPPGYQVQYILTQGPTYIIEQFSPAPIFAIHDTGCFTIHTLVYDPTTLNLGAVVFGSTVSSQLGGLVTGTGTICASLDIVGAPFCVYDCSNICAADAGTITADSSSVCGSGGSALLTATPDGNQNVPAGFQTIYALTDASGVIVQVNGMPSFTVSSYGNYTIHTLVYDPTTLDLSTVVLGTTTGADVNALLSVGGGGSICGDLDVAGALITYFDCSAGCNAFAGTITPNFVDICYGDSVPAILVATHDGNWSIPAGYQVTYVLTEGSSNIIQAVTDSAASFAVADSGDYFIHTLVYDPTTLDLSTIQLGVTSASDVNALLQQGGGAICASLDLAGAYFDVLHCSVLCQAFAGSHTAIQSIVCADTINGASIGATADGNQIIPPGYLMGYALTYGPDLIVQQASFQPNFTVYDTGWYQIHALVYDPITLNLSVVTPGTTAAIDLVGLLIQGGGTICASLDLPGVPIYVDPCLVTGLDDAQSSGMRVWPNPVSNLLNVEVLNGTEGNLTIMDSKGATVVQERLNAQFITLNLAALDAGIYIVELASNDSVWRQRIVLNR